MNVDVSRCVSFFMLFSFRFLFFVSVSWGEHYVVESGDLFFSLMISLFISFTRVTSG